MADPPQVSIARIRHGVFDEALPLNPRFIPGRPLLIATLEIDWKPADPVRALSALERALLAFSPLFARHECRGEGIYHVFRPDRNSHRRPRSARHREEGAAHGPMEGALALAHLIEHAVIDFQSDVTGMTRISGITAAHRHAPGRFDLMVECLEPEVGSCCLRLAAAWLAAALDGEGPGAEEREVLNLLRLIRSLLRRSFFAPEVARRLGWSEERTVRGLEALRRAGYLEEAPSTMNFSGFREYRLRGKRAAWDSAGSPPPGTLDSGEDSLRG